MTARDYATRPSARSTCRSPREIFPEDHRGREGDSSTRVCGFSAGRHDRLSSAEVVHRSAESLPQSRAPGETAVSRPRSRSTRPVRGTTRRSQKEVLPTLARALLAGASSSASSSQQRSTSSRRARGILAMGKKLFSQTTARQMKEGREGHRPRRRAAEVVARSRAIIHGRRFLTPTVHGGEVARPYPRTEGRRRVSRPGETCGRDHDIPAAVLRQHGDRRLR